MPKHNVAEGQRGASTYSSMHSGTTCMEKGPSCDVTTYSVVLHIPCILWNSEGQPFAAERPTYGYRSELFNCRVHSCTPPQLPAIPFCHDQHRGHSLSTPSVFRGSPSWKLSHFRLVSFTLRTYYVVTRTRTSFVRSKAIRGTDPAEIPPRGSIGRLCLKLHD